jgi:predicted lipid carrier protein YhbT
MPPIDPATLSSLDAAQLTQLVRTTPEGELTAVMQSDARTKVLDEVFSRFPALFRADRAGSTSAVIHWNIADRPGGGEDTYELVIDNGVCTVANPPEHEPKLSVTLGAVDFLKVAAGTANPVMMFMTGKLKARGDLGLAANIANLFDLPKS